MVTILEECTSPPSSKPVALAPEYWTILDLGSHSLLLQKSFQNTGIKHHYGHEHRCGQLVLRRLVQG